MSNSQNESENIKSSDPSVVNNLNINNADFSNIHEPNFQSLIPLKNQPLNTQSQSLHQQQSESEQFNAQNKSDYLFHEKKNENKNLNQENKEKNSDQEKDKKSGKEKKSKKVKIKIDNSKKFLLIDSKSIHKLGGKIDSLINNIGLLTEKINISNSNQEKLLKEMKILNNNQEKLLKEMNASNSTQVKLLNSLAKNYFPEEIESQKLGLESAGKKE